MHTCPRNCSKHFILITSFTLQHTTKRYSGSLKGEVCTPSLHMQQGNMIWGLGFLYLEKRHKSYTSSCIGIHLQKQDSLCILDLCTRPVNICLSMVHYILFSFSVAIFVIVIRKEYGFLPHILLTYLQIAPSDIFSFI